MIMIIANNAKNQVNDSGATTNKYNSKRVPILGHIVEFTDICRLSLWYTRIRSDTNQT